MRGSFVCVCTLNTLSNIGNSALNLVHTNRLMSGFDSGSWPPNWLQGKAKISNPKKNERNNKEWERGHTICYIFSLVYIAKDTLVPVFIVQLWKLCVVWWCQTTEIKILNWAYIYRKIIIIRKIIWPPFWSNVNDQQRFSFEYV